MSEARRQHPVAAMTKVIDIIKGNFITLLILLFVGGSGDEESLINITWLLGMIVFLLVWGVLSWMRFRYRIVDGELQIEYGVIIHKNLYLSKDRIQVIDISAGMLQRLFGLVSVEVKTAGQSSRETKLSAVTREEAENLRSELRKLVDENNESDESIGQNIPESYQLSNMDLLIAASTSGRFGIALSILGAVFSQLDEFVSDEEIISFVESVVPSFTSLNLIVSSIIILIIVAWILTFIGTVFRFGNFSVTVHEEELVISHGIFEKKQLTIPYNRIQAIQIKEELLRQPFGYAAITLESAGYGDENEQSATLFPLIRKSYLPGFLEEVVPDYHISAEAVTPPPRALRRYLFRMALFSAAVIFPLARWTFIGIYALFLVIPALLLGYAQYKDAAVGVHNKTLIMRYRLLGKTTAIVKKYRIQASELQSTYFQRARKLNNFSVTVASQRRGQTFRVRDLKEETGERFQDWISYATTEDSGELNVTRIIPDF